MCPVRVRLLLGWVFVACCASVASAAETLTPGLQWKDPSEVRLRVDFPGEGYRAEWQLFRCRCGDLLVRTELNEPGETVHGDIALIGKRALLTRGFDADAAELVSIDAPALMMQLALRLLERAEPGGPAAVVKRRPVAVTEENRPIQLDTGTAVGGFPAPWSVSGELWPVNETGRRFDLEFRFSTGGAAGAEAQQGEMRLAGEAEYARRDFPLDPGAGLDEWSLEWRDADDPLAQSDFRPESLEDLRRRIRESSN
ncbi:hypothetical protein [Elongatibacter sediminis]|uniref:Uncharacterized protein n=1 Tax=Elongatibacter sediminis TaxID=3119006 RepID=A0AAW9RLV9_9GAMM